MISSSISEELISTLQDSVAWGTAFRADAMAALARLPNYNWCGIYRLEGGELILDEFVGEATEHSRIPVGRGVCGLAVAEKANQVVKDVRELTNYLSCSVSTRSEIVVLIHLDGEILGQIDIDGHTVGAFDESDEAMLEDVAALCAARW